MSASPRIAPATAPYPAEIQARFDALMPSGVAPLTLFRTLARDQQLTTLAVHVTEPGIRDHHAFKTEGLGRRGRSLQSARVHGLSVGLGPALINVDSTIKVRCVRFVDGE